MPITNIENTKQLEFGYGDIQVSPGLLDGHNDTGVVIFRPQEPHEIGSHIDHEPNEKVDVSESPIRMLFDKVESIDVVIWALEETKKFMLAGTTKIE